MILDKLKSNPCYLDNPAEKIDFRHDKWAALFLNMGGPETLDDVEPYRWPALFPHGAHPGHANIMRPSAAVHRFSNGAVLPPKASPGT